MEAAFIINAALLTAFALLATYDGFYLHIFKYQLHRFAESRNEHITHTIRAILFPGILFFLFYQQNSTLSFWIGIGLVALDILTLGIDAYMEKDSRMFMGGLPRWEYIIHLFVNGFHFASIAVFLAMKIDLLPGGMALVPSLEMQPGFQLFKLLVINVIPGAVLMAVLHLLVIFPATARYWNTTRARVLCC